MLPYIDRQNGALKTEGSPESVVTDVVSSSVTYVGRAVAGSSTASAVWRIFKLSTTVAGSIQIQYASGSPNYTQVWDNRASLSYS